MKSPRPAGASERLESWPTWASVEREVMAQERLEQTKELGAYKQAAEPAPPAGAVSVSASLLDATLGTRQADRSSANGHPGL